MPYYLVEGEITDYCDEYVEAKGKKDALRIAQDLNEGAIDPSTVHIVKITKKQYDEVMG